jgi:uncharacterized lipoprotein YmbA
MMPPLKNKWTRWISGGAFLLFLGGCVGPSAPVHFYTLAPVVEMPSEAVRADFPEKFIVGIGPVEIPEIYNRPQIVTKGDQNRVALSEYHRWAGPLQEEISTVIAENLSPLLRSEHIVCVPWDGLREPDIHIFIKIHRFHGVLGKTALLAAAWSIQGPQVRNTPVIKKTFLEESMENATYPAYVSAQNRLLAAFSRELALEIADWMQSK